MATSSIRKNFVVNSKKSAMEIASQLVSAENTSLPKTDRKHISNVLRGEGLLNFLRKSENKTRG